MWLSSLQLLRKDWDKRLVILLLFLSGSRTSAQSGFLAQVPPAARVQALWQYSYSNHIADQDSVVAHRFLTAVAFTADSLGDNKLKSYAHYFLICYRLLFSKQYELYFPEGDYQRAVAIFERAKAWAHQAGYSAIVASCEHYTGQVYFQAGRFGPAFEHLLKAQKAFEKIGYENVPNASGYLYYLGLAYYRSEEWDKAREAFLSAARYSFYLPRNELNAYNSIGLIYVRKKEWDKGILFYRKAIAKAVAYHNLTWVGIASGNLGNVFMQRQQYDSGLFYHRINYNINSSASSKAPEDAAFTSLAMATAFIRQQQPDSAQYFIRSGEELSHKNFKEFTDQLEFRKRLLLVLVELNKMKGDYRTVSLLSDSLTVIKDSLQLLLDSKILNRAIEKAKAEQYGAELKLLESEKNLSQLRFYIVIATLLFVIVTGALLFNRFRMRKQREVELAEKEGQLLGLEKRRVEESLRHAQELLAVYLNTIKEKTALMENLDAELEHLKETTYAANHLEGIAANREKLVSSTILTDEDWRHFRGLFDQVHPGFLYRLKEKLPGLSPAEIRLLLLTKLNLSTREMAHMLGISTDAIRKTRYRLRKKFSLEEESTLDTLIQRI